RVGGITTIRGMRGTPGQAGNGDIIDLDSTETTVRDQREIGPIRRTDR
ncbi:MAG: hypothetical protein QOG64_924, partial [Acidimicrobiaceae bacterium]|nr:hypothetical protein [Acidimicrobiaceae bacterium]